MDHTRCLRTPAVLKPEGTHKDIYLLPTCVHFTQWTLIHQTAYSCNKFQRPCVRGKKKNLCPKRHHNRAVDSSYYPPHPHHGSTALLRGFKAAFRTSLRHIAVCIKFAIPTNTQHKEIQKRCHSAQMISIDGTNKTFSNYKP